MDLNNEHRIIFSFIEHKVELWDSILQLFDNPNRFSLLEVDKSSRIDHTVSSKSDTIFSFQIDLS